MIKIKKGIIENQMYFNSSVEMLDNAHNLRLSATTAEALLWEKLRNRNLNGLKFRRQHAIAGFIADFYCHEIRLIIEVDGSIHNESNQNQRDEDRTFELEKLGLKIIRFTNEEIKSNINKVLYKIVEEVNNFIPSPFPSPSGDGCSKAQFYHVDQRGEVKTQKHMSHKTHIATFILAFLTITISAQQQSKKTAVVAQPAQAQIQLKTPTDSNQYILGAYLGQYIVSNGFSISNADLFIKGMNDAIGNKPLLVPAESINSKIAEYQNSLAVERNSLLEKQLFESLKTQAGLGMLPNGVYYSILKTGSGRRPLANDSILLNVKGYLPDGKMFEDTYQKKAPYRVTPAGLIPGMNEAIQIMPAGSTWRLFIPSSQAFGEKGLQGLIPPYSAVIFDVELLEVK